MFTQHYAVVSWARWLVAISLVLSSLPIADFGSQTADRGSVAAPLDALPSSTTFVSPLPPPQDSAGLQLSTTFASPLPTPTPRATGTPAEREKPGVPLQSADGRVVIEFPAGRKGAEVTYSDVITQPAPCLTPKGARSRYAVRPNLCRCASTCLCR